MTDTVSALGGTRSPGEVKRSQGSPSVQSDALVGVHPRHRPGEVGIQPLRAGVAEARQRPVPPGLPYRCDVVSSAGSRPGAGGEEPVARLVEVDDRVGIVQPPL